MKKGFALILCALFLSAAVLTACADAGGNSEVSSSTDTDETAEETTGVTLDLPELDYEGASFNFGVVDNANADNVIVVEEQNGEVVNDAKYNTISSVSSLLNVEITQYVMTKGYPAASALIPFILAGDDTIQVANVFCVDAPTLAAEGYITDYSLIPNIDPDKPYWDQNVSDAMVIGKMRYAAIGDLSLSTNDLTYVLVFSKSQIADYNLTSPYDLVKSGSWTMDAMAEMMVTATGDLDGDGKMTIDDNYGYAAHSKMTLPSFWVGAGEKSVELDENGYPVLTMTDERFVAVFEKIFAITVDNGVKYSGADRDKGQDVPDASLTLFKNNRVLFMDCSMFYFSSLRDMDTDFGIIPYPKYDDTQTDYCVRVSYYMPPIIPITNGVHELTGAVLEAANYYASLLMRPAYYDVSLKGKITRDEESAEMLDLIFSNRAVDLGDTLFCADIRDGFVAGMFSSDDRDIISAVGKRESALAAKFAQFAQS